MKISTAILLINVGTPDSPRVGDVRRYLSEFLNDGRVIDMPAIPRFLLVNGIIVPFRAPRSAGLYQKLWSEEGSPLLVYGNRLKERLQRALGSGCDTFLAMRYGNPRLKNVLEEIRKTGYDRLVVVPLFPQYASSTAGTAIQKVMGIISEWNAVPEVKIVGQFWNNPSFIDAFVENINLFDPEDYDHVLFSYHGLPLSHINSIHPQVRAEACNCTEMMPAHGKFCYRATCYATTRLLADKLGLDGSRYSVAFQSRLTKKWLTPFSDQVLIEMAEKGIRKVLVAAPSFVTDCLETTYEIGVEYREIFRKHGGEQLDLVPSLNDSPLWIDALKSLVTED